MNSGANLCRTTAKPAGETTFACLCYDDSKKLQWVSGKNADTQCTQPTWKPVGNPALDGQEGPLCRFKYGSSYAIGWTVATVNAQGKPESKCM